MWVLKASPVGGIMKLQPDDRLVRRARSHHIGAHDPDRADAQDLADTLTDLFDLCRYWQILSKAPHGTPCAYHEMGRSPAPCAGLIPMEQYNQTVRHAMAFAGRDRAKVLAEKQTEMKTAASQLQFERAARIKDWLKRTTPLGELRYAHLGEMERFVGPGALESSERRSGHSSSGQECWRSGEAGEALPGRGAPGHLADAPGGRPDDGSPMMQPGSGSADC